MYVNLSTKEALWDKYYTGAPAQHGTKHVSNMVKQLGNPINGIIVTGDIAYSGKREQYVEAGEWLDRVAYEAGCSNTDVQIVPGNHDIDRDQITRGAELLLQDIAENGQDALDTILESESDRELLYKRFAAYQPFSEGYNCPLHKKGGGASDRKVKLAPGRWLRIIGLNTALICSNNDQKGQLILGQRQQTLPKEAGQELVILAHHPLHWLQDSEQVRRFVRSRARVFISGHEHNPSVIVEEIEEGQELMMLDAGATVPPTAEGEYNYTYNVLEFDWCGEKDALKVTVYPRAWSDVRKTFVEDTVGLGTSTPQFVLASPNFREGKTPIIDEASEPHTTGNKQGHTKEDAINQDKESEIAMPDQYSLALLHFFRDLSAGQRLEILVKLLEVSIKVMPFLEKALKSNMQMYVVSRSLEEASIEATPLLHEVLKNCAADIEPQHLISLATISKASNQRISSNLDLLLKSSPKVIKGFAENIDFFSKRLVQLTPSVFTEEVISKWSDLLEDSNKFDPKKQLKAANFILDFVFCHPQKSELSPLIVTSFPIVYSNVSREKQTVSFFPFLPMIRIDERKNLVHKLGV